MSNEEILDKIYPGCDCIEAYKARGLVDPGCARCNTIDFTLEAMDQARKDEAIRFVEWFIKYLMLENRDTYSIEERYNQFKQSKQ